jgi:D-alanine-D-alanine ligase-like ATP-grasp enzyme
MTAGKVISIDLLKQLLVERGWTTWRERQNGILKEYFKLGSYEWSTKHSIVEYPMVDHRTRQIINSKIAADQVAKKLGVSIPDSIIVKSDQKFTEAESFLNAHTIVVVKPANSSGSQGVTLKIQDVEVLGRAINEARSFSSDVIVQQQVDGSEFRFTCLNGKVISVVEKRFPYLIGDGVSTLQELLDDDNQQRAICNKNSIVQYPNLELPSHCDPQRVLKKGESLQIGASSLISKGASIYEVVDDIHRSYKLIAQKMANEIKANFVVVDIIIADMHQDANESNYWFLEFNGGPALTMYRSLRGGEPVDVVSLLCDEIDRLARQN